MRKQLTPTRIIAMGFLGVILLGALLLCLPAASKAHTATAFVDALFTSTSATCVTGLVVFDTFAYWSLLGQIVILVLIQIGGLGFVSFTIALFMILNKRIGLKNRNLMQEAVSAPQLGGIVRLTRFIIFGTMIFELGGALLLSFVFVPRYGFGKGLYFSLFHAVSAFCNAGFDILGTAQAPFASLADYAADWYVNLVVMALIVIGGLGFFVWHDLVSKKGRWHRLTLHTKIVLITTGILILVPAVLIFFTERAGGCYDGKSVSEGVVGALFQSVTTRTAGFATMNLTEMKDSSLLLMMLLMFVGGSPGSTAGGLKTSTLAVLFLSTVSFLRKKDSVECLGRRLDLSLLRRAVAILMILLICVVSASLILILADGVSIRDAVFESVSAVATVGLSLGVTPTLSVVSKIALMLLMFIGRVGCLTLLLSFGTRVTKKTRVLPLEQITVG